MRKQGTPRRLPLVASQLADFPMRLAACLRLSLSEYPVILYPYLFYLLQNGVSLPWFL